MKNIGFIYENDIPGTHELHCARMDNELEKYPLTRMPKPSDFLDHKFKPNGITDNKEEWEEKYFEWLLDECDKITTPELDLSKL